MSNERIEEIKVELERLNEVLEEQNGLLIESKDEVSEWEADEYDHEEGYKESLDEEGTVSVCGMDFEPSRILEELDNTAYRCGLSDYLATINIEDDVEGKLLLEQVEECETNIEDTEGEIFNLNEELEELEE